MIGFSTDQAFDMVMPRHKVLPADKRPSLKFRFISGRERIQLEQLFERTEGTPNSVYMQRCFDTVRQYLVGWSHQGIEFDRDKLEDVASWEDLCTIKSIWSFGALEIEDQKKSS